MLTPHQIVAELDKYIIGQTEAKRHVAVALRNRWRRMQVKDQIQTDIIPNNILMIGPTGVGKTEIARRLAKIAKVPFIKVEASKFTEVGYVGKDVESMVRDLAERAVAMIKAEKIAGVQSQAEQQVQEMILDILVPPQGGQHAGGDCHTRAHFRKQLKEGTLDGQLIEIKLNPNPRSTPMQMMGGVPAMDEGMMMQFQEMMNQFLPDKKQTKKVAIAEAKKLLLAEAVHRLLNMPMIQKEALERVGNSGIIFIDEIDKIAHVQSNNGPGVSREGVQRDLLPIIEGSAVQTKYGTVDTDHILFIGAGAFHMAKPSDLIPELQGRFPIRVTLESLSEDDFYKILNEPQSALPRQYQALLEVEGIILTFDEGAKKEIAQTACLINRSVENIGARRLQTMMSYLLNPILFDVPEVIIPNTALTITQEKVKEALAPLTEKQDVNQYIL